MKQNLTILLLAANITGCDSKIMKGPPDEFVYHDGIEQVGSYDELLLMPTNQRKPFMVRYCTNNGRAYALCADMRSWVWLDSGADPTFKMTGGTWISGHTVDRAEKLKRLPAWHKTEGESVFVTDEQKFYWLERDLVTWSNRGTMTVLPMRPTPAAPKGYPVFDSLEKLLDIPDGRLEKGLVVYVMKESKYYECQADLRTWIETQPPTQ